MSSLLRVYLVAACVVAAGAIVVLTVLQPVLGSSRPFSVYNANWDGASDWGSIVDPSGRPLSGFDGGGGATLVAHRSLVEIDLDAGRSTLVILGPQLPPSPEEASWLGRFVREGGRLAVIDDFGYGNAFLAASGARSRLDGGLLRSLVYADVPESVVAAPTAPHVVTRDAPSVVFNLASVVRAHEDATVLLSAPRASWVGPAEPVRSVPPLGTALALLVIEPVGAGEVLILSDPSPFTNSMLGAGGNRALAAGLVQWGTEDGRRIVLDESHRGIPEILLPVGAFLESLARLRWAIGLAGLGVLAAFAMHGSPWIARRRRMLRARLERALPSARPDDDAVVRRVLARHPGWDERALRGILVAWGDRR